jgi:hypothetical protein
MHHTIQLHREANYLLCFPAVLTATNMRYRRADSVEQWLYNTEEAAKPAHGWNKCRLHHDPAGCVYCQHAVVPAVHEIIRFM